MKKPTATVGLLVSKHMVLTPQFPRESLFGKRLEKGKTPKVLCKDMTKTFEMVTKECNLLSSLFWNHATSSKVNKYFFIRLYKNIADKDSP